MSKLYDSLGILSIYGIIFFLLNFLELIQSLKSVFADVDFGPLPHTY